jgi:hypothetical protein
MKHEKIVANTVKTRLFKRGLAIFPHALVQGPKVMEGGNIIGLVLITAASVLSDVVMPA